MGDVRNGAGSYTNIRCTWVAASLWNAQMSRGRGMTGMCRCDGGMTHRPGMWAGFMLMRSGGGAYVRKASDWSVL